MTNLLPHDTTGKYKTLTGFKSSVCRPANPDFPPLNRKQT